MSVMDSLFKRINLDFEFTIYDLLACTTEDGIMAFVAGSKTIQEVQLESDRKID
jgi:hypothetical protein